MFGKELFIRFSASAFRKLPSIYVFSYFPFGFEGRMWDLIVSVPDHCLSFYFPFAVVGKSCNRSGPDRSSGNYRISPTDNYGQLRIPIPGFSADTG